MTLTSQQAEGLPPELRITPPASLRIGAVIGESNGWQDFLAWDKRRQCDVALIVPAAGRRNNRPFVEERLARAGATLKLRHPGIVAVLDTGDGDNPYIVEEIVEGPSLRDVLEDQGWLEPRDALAIAAQIARALDFAHARKHIHGQLGLSDILIDERSGRVKVQGFAAAATDDDRSGIRAPETIAGDDPDGRADLFVLGSILYRCLCARPAFTARDPEALAKNILESEPRPLGELRSVLPAPVVRIVERLLSKDRRQRFQTGNALAEAIERMLPSLPELRDEAPNLLPDVPEKGELPPVRHPAGIFAAVTLAVLAAGGLYYHFGRTGGDPPENRQLDLPDPPTAAIPSIPEIVTQPRPGNLPPEALDDPARDVVQTPRPVDDAWHEVAGEINRLGCTRVETEPGWFDRDIIARFGDIRSEIPLARKLGGLGNVHEVRIWKADIDPAVCELLDLLGNRTGVADRRLLDILPPRDDFRFATGERLAVDVRAPDERSFVTVDHVAADGSVQRLWPEGGASIALVPGETVRIGGENGEGLLEVAPAAGSELLVLIASPKPLPLTVDPGATVPAYLGQLREALDKTGEDAADEDAADEDAADVLSSVLLFETSNATTGTGSATGYSD